jgi:hypothetical protein
MSQQLDLVDLLAYPQGPGWKAQDTSRAAAQGMAPKAMGLRERILAELQHFDGSPEMLAQRLNEPVMNIRPRLSELLKAGKVRDTGRRALAQGGRKAIVWEAVR